jgi:hypothetical protein
MKKMKKGRGRAKSHGDPDDGAISEERVRLPGEISRREERAMPSGASNRLFLAWSAILSAKLCPPPGQEEGRGSRLTLEKAALKQ